MLLGHRYYDVSTGRFLSEDPGRDGANWYAYCENNPLGAVDPSGLFARAFTGEFNGEAILRERNAQADAFLNRLASQASNDPILVSTGGTVQQQTNLAQAIASRDKAWIETMVDTYVADEDVARQVTMRILNSDLPSKMHLSSAAKKKGALSFAEQLIQHVENIGKYSSNNGYLSDAYREIRNFSVRLGKTMKVK